MTRSISNSADVLDSRDIIERIKELEGEYEALADAVKDAEPEDKEDAETALSEWDESEDGREFEALKALQEDASGSGDWVYGATLVRESYFTDYAKELCEDIGDIPKDLPWYIESAIDWDKVADAIQQDYTTAEFDGVTYYVR